MSSVFVEDETVHRKAIRRIAGLVVLLTFSLSVLSGVTEAANLEIVPSASAARYRVREQLAGKNFLSDAVGTTRSISGAVSLDARGRLLPGSKITVDLRTLVSDEARRDNYLRRNTLDTASFPYTEFVLREMHGLPFPLPGSGRANVQMRGDLTVRGVARPVVWDGTVEFQGNSVRLQARTAFKFGDFELTRPRVLLVLSVEDNIRLEVNLTLRPVS